MNKYVKMFIARGSMFAWGGPVIVAIVMACLKKAEVVSTVTVDEMVCGIISSAVMAFIAAGVSVVYRIDSLPKAMAGLIQAAVLYIDYLAVYLLNGWLATNKIWIFSLIFIAGFLIIWLSIFTAVKVKTDKINKMLRQ